VTDLWYNWMAVNVCQHFMFCWPFILLQSFEITNLTHRSFFFYLFIPILYMFRVTMYSSSGETIVSTQPLVCVTLCRWPCGMHV